MRKQASEEEEENMETRKIKTTTFIGTFEDFENTDKSIEPNKAYSEKIRAWQRAYFDLLSWKNTYYIPLIMDICSTNNHEAYLKVVVKNKSAEVTRSVLENLGYKVDEYETDTLVVELDWDIDCDDAVIEW